MHDDNSHIYIIFLPSYNNNVILSWDIENRPPARVAGRAKTIQYNIINNNILAIGCRGGAGIVRTGFFFVIAVRVSRFAFLPARGERGCRGSKRFYALVALCSRRARDQQLVDLGTYSCCRCCRSVYMHTHAWHISG